MVVELRNNHSKIIGFQQLEKTLQTELRATCSYFDPKAYHSTAYKKRRWDGRYYLINKSGMYPTGLSASVIKIMKEYGCVEVADRRSIPQSHFSWKWNKKWKLRDYQSEVVKKALEIHRGVFEIPTRGGKTLIAANIIQPLGLRTLVVVVGRESMRQTAEDFGEFINGPNIGFYGDGKKNPEADILIALMPSLIRAKNLDAILDRDILIIDEVHTAPAKTYYKTLMHCEAYYRFGMSGTVLREDGGAMRMIAITGRMFHEEKAKTLWEAGHIMKPIIEWMTFEADKIHSVVDYQSAYTEGIVDCEPRNDLIADLAIKHAVFGDKVLISVERVRHGREILKVIENKDKDKVKVAYIHDKAKGRDAVFEDFKIGDLSILISTRILNQSVTIPDLSILINAAGRKSEIELIQKIGRVLGKGNKIKVRIYDFIDKHCRYLYSHSVSRAKKLKGREYEQVGLKKFKNKDTITLSKL